MNSAAYFDQIWNKRGAIVKGRYSDGGYAAG